MSSLQVRSSHDESNSRALHYIKMVLYYGGQLEKLCRTPPLPSVARCSQGQIATTTTTADDASYPCRYTAHAPPGPARTEWQDNTYPGCPPPLHVPPLLETASCNRGQAQPTQPTVECVPPTHCSGFDLLNAAVQHSARATATDNTKLKPDFSDDGAPATDPPKRRAKTTKNRTPKRRTKTTKNRSGAGWNGCNLYKSHRKHCWVTGDQAVLDVHDYATQHVSSAGTPYKPRKNRKTMCTVACKPSTLDLSKGEGSNLNKTGSFLLDEWRNLDDEIKLIYNKEAQLIKVKSH